MATSGRAALIIKIYKALKKHYGTVPLIPERSLLEQLLFACCLEDSPFEAAQTAFDALVHEYFDWNEVRVSTVVELAETIAGLHDAREAARNVRGVLQGVFEGTYSFDIEVMKKKNIGQAVKELQQYAGVTQFVSGFATQNALGGHAIPLDRGALDALFALGAISEKERSANTAPGLERAIPKSKGIEFGCLLHCLGAELIAKPFSSDVRNWFIKIAPDAKERLPKRAAKKTPAESDDKKAEPPASSKRETKKKTSPAASKTSAKTSAKGKSADEKKVAPAKRKSAPKKAIASKKTAAKGLARKKPR